MIRMRSLKLLGWVICFLMLLLGCVYVLKDLGYGLIVQKTPSMPEGIYISYPSSHYHIGDTVIFNLPSKWMQYILARGYLSQPEPLMKKILAEEGDKVCFYGDEVMINNHTILPLFKMDSKHRLLPQRDIRKDECFIVGKNEYFMAGDASIHSFDSRYFGLIFRSAIIAKAKLIWTKTEN